MINLRIKYRSDKKVYTCFSSDAKTRNIGWATENGSPASNGRVYPGSPFD